MITVTQYSHFPNNTELGKGNTHECYLLIPNSYDLSKIFPSGEEVEVIDVLDDNNILVKYNNNLYSLDTGEITFHKN